jgi:hypothetical protein
MGKQVLSELTAAVLQEETGASDLQHTERERETEGDWWKKKNSEETVLLFFNIGLNLGWRQ